MKKLIMIFVLMLSSSVFARNGKIFVVDPRKVDIKHVGKVGHTTGVVKIIDHEHQIICYAVTNNWNPSDGGVTCLPMPKKK